MMNALLYGRCPYLISTSNETENNNMTAARIRTYDEMLAAWCDIIWQLLMVLTAS